MKRKKLITILVNKHEQQTIKVKHKSKGREMQTQNNTRHVIKEETKKLNEKPFCDPPS